MTNARWLGALLLPSLLSLIGAGCGGAPAGDPPFAPPSHQALPAPAETMEAEPQSPTFTSTTPPSPSRTSTTVAVNGTAPAASTVRLYTTADCSGQPVGSQIAGADGRFSISVQVPRNSTTTFRGTATLVNVVSKCSTSSITYVHDDTSPAPPVLGRTEPGSPSQDTSPRVEGTAEANATIRLYNAGACTGTPAATTTADASGAFSVQVPVREDTTNDLVATATDAAGNTSGCSAPLGYLHDGIAPAAPSVTGTTPASPSNNPMPTVHGQAEAGATVRVYAYLICDSTPLASGAADATGAFAIPVSVEHNQYNRFYVTATDVAGNTSPCASSNVSYTHDDVPPQLPTLSELDPPSPSSNPRPTVSGTGDRDGTVRLYARADFGGPLLGSVTPFWFGRFEIAVDVAPNATTSIHAAAIDAAGNVSLCSSGLTYRHDDTPPAPPVLVRTVPASPSSVQTPRIEGTAEPGATVRIYESSTCDGFGVTTTAAADGTFSAELTVGWQSNTALTATATDDVGNVSSCSNALGYRHDAFPPSLPSNLTIAPASPSADTSPIVAGQTEQDTTVRLYQTADCTGQAVASTSDTGSGTFSFELTVEPGQTATWFAQAMDAAGNVSGCSSGVTYVHDPRCGTGFSNCDGVASNGCEANLGSDPANCGTCGLACVSGPNAVGVCTSGTCGLACHEGFGNCNGSTADGCEADLGSPSNCGACGNTCATPPNATATCGSGQCGFTCEDGFANCDGQAANGCEANLGTPSNCGACGNACAARPNTLPACTQGQCTFVCQPDFSDCDGDPLNGCETQGTCSSTCPVDSDRELLITHLGVVEDPVRTTGLGAWTFGRLMTDMAGQQDPSTFVRDWLQTWLSNQTVNGFTVPARQPMQSLVLQPWEQRSGGPQLDLAQAPFRLLAIVNRIDLRNLPESAGEGRFVFGVVSANGTPLQFTVILEYKLPGTTQADVDQWAADWHALGTLTLGSPEYNAALQAITDRFTGPNRAPGAPNGSAISQIRTNEIALSSSWEMREYHLTASGLALATVQQTPALAFNGTTTLADLINQNEAGLLAGTHVVPLTFNGNPFRGGAAITNPGMFWNAPGINNNQARHLFSLNTCNGCHAGETNTAFTHVQPRSAGQPAPLSGFLTGTFVVDPVSRTSRSFNDLARRREDLAGLVCPPALTRQESGAALQSRVPASRTPRSRVH